MKIGKQSVQDPSKPQQAGSMQELQDKTAKIPNLVPSLTPIPANLPPSTLIVDDINANIAPAQPPRQQNIVAQQSCRRNKVCDVLMFVLKIPLFLLFYVLVADMFILVIIAIILIVVLQGSFYYSTAYCQGQSGGCVYCLAIFFPIIIIPLLMLGGMVLSVKANYQRFSGWFGSMKQSEADVRKRICQL